MGNHGHAVVGVAAGGEDQAKRRIGRQVETRRNQIR